MFSIPQIFAARHRFGADSQILLSADSILTSRTEGGTISVRGFACGTTEGLPASPNRISGGIGMKWLIASDVHGSAYYCEKLIQSFAREGADRLLLLGDLLYHGPRNDLPRDYSTKETAALLNTLRDKIVCVRGNCDADVDRMMLSFPIETECAMLAEGKRLIFCTHGHVFNDKNMPLLTPGDILLHGHTHIPRCDDVGGITVMNPGSVSIPKGGSTNSYMTLENGLFLWKDLCGNICREFRIGD